MMKKSEQVKEVTMPVQPFQSSDTHEEWISAGFTVQSNEYGTYYVKTDLFSFDYVHGNKPLGDIVPLIENAKQLFLGHPLTPAEAGNIFFYDTETTGLKGAGVQIFLNGFVERVPAGYKVTQYLLASPSEELAMLHALPIQDGDTLITYNGKSFDIPQLEVRWTMNRNELRAFPKVHQVDLLHGSKRLWKGEQGRFKLQDMEIEQLGFTRTDDLPGHLAPLVYFDALKTGKAENLLRVFEHNLWDLISLVALYRQTLEHLTGEVRGTSAPTELNLAKWLRDLKFFPHSEELYETILNTYEKQDIPHAYYYLGLFYKKNGNPQAAVELIETASSWLMDREQLESYLHLAKLYEHQLKEYERALYFTNRAKQTLLTLTGQLKREKLAYYLQDLKTRDARINRKIISRESASFDK